MASKMFTLRLDENMFQTIVQEAGKRRIPTSDYVRSLINIGRQQIHFLEYAEHQKVVNRELLKRLTAVAMMSQKAAGLSDEDLGGMEGRILSSVDGFFDSIDTASGE